MVIECPIGKYFFVCNLNLVLLSAVYLLCALISFAPNYTTDDTLVVFGFISILTLIGCPIGYAGCQQDYPSLLLINVVINTLWVTSAIIYLTLYIWLMDSNISYYPLHHSMVFVYFTMSFSAIILASILIISTVSRPIEQSSLKRD